MTTKTLESAYFHTGNSGITLSIDEVGGVTAVSPKRYRFNSQHSAFGTYTEVSLPLGSLHMVEYLIEALTRTKEHMIKQDFKAEYALSHGEEQSVDAYINVIEGLRRERITEEIVVGKNSTETHTVGFNYYDGDKLVKTEKVDWNDYPVYCSGDSGSDGE